MHNSTTVIGIAAYLTALSLAMSLGSCIKGNPNEHPAAKRRRQMAAGIATLTALVVAGIFLWYRHNELREATTWAVVAIIVFGGSYALYQVIPKIPEPCPDIEQVACRYRVTNAAHTVALVVGLVAAVVAYHTTKNQ